MCFIKSHKTHDCSDIEEVSDNLRSLVITDMDNVNDFFRKTGELLPHLEKEENDIIKHLAGIEDEINTVADKLIAAIQHDREKLLSEVESIKLKRVEQLEMVKQELEQHMTALENFKRYSEMLLSSGTACDVTRSAYSLHDRADELMKFDVISHVDSSVPPVNVTFFLTHPWMEMTEILLEPLVKYFITSGTKKKRILVEVGFWWILLAGFLYGSTQQNPVGSFGVWTRVSDVTW